MPIVFVRILYPAEMVRPSGSGAVAWQLVVAPMIAVSGKAGAQVYWHVVLTACAALAPYISKIVVAPSSIMRIGWGVCVPPCTKATVTAMSCHVFPAGTVMVHSA